jgi:hypothetical protein
MEAKRYMFQTLKISWLLIFLNLILTLPSFGADGNKLWDIDGVPVTQASQDQEYVRVTKDSSGGAIIVWQDERDGDEEIYVQRLDSDGTPLWDTDGVRIAEGSSPAIDSDEDGGTLIAWHNASGVFAQRIDSNGVAQWGADGKKIGNSGYEHPKVCSDGNGGAFVTFFALVPPSPRIAHINSNGILTAPGIDGVALSEGVLAYGDPVLASDGGGGVIVAWANGIENIIAHRVDAFLNLLWGTAPMVISNDPRRESRPEIVSDGFGGAIITWVRQPEVGYPNTQIVVQRIDGGGNPVWTPGGVILVDSDTVGGNANAWGAYEVTPVVTTDGAGGAILAWNDWRNEPDYPGGNDDIFAQRVDARGAAQWTSGGVSIHPFPGGSQRRPRIVSDRSGGAIVTFQDKGLWSWDIYAVGLDGNGSAWTSYVFYDGSPTEPGEDQEDPWIVFDGSGSDPTGAIIVWVDERGSGTDVYAQKLEATVSTKRLEVGPSGYPYTSIQTAIEDASDGDVILVHNGTYVEHINFGGKAIAVQSENGAGATIIDGANSGSVVIFTQGEGAGSVLEGFTVRNGSETSGGGIRCSNSSPSILNCVIVENTATYLQGGGVYCYNSSPTIVNCVIARNKSPNPIGRGGGGIGCYNNSSPTIINCSVYANTAFVYAGGIVSTTSAPTVVNSIFWGNSVNGSLGQIYTESGGSIDVSYSNVQQDSGTYPGLGNINANPMFENPASHSFRLLPESPCIDTGINTALGIPAKDFEGDSRVLDGDEDGTPTTDMGVDEFIEKPDVIVESIVIDSVNLKPYDPFTVFVTIRNRGTADIPGTFPYLPFQSAFNSGTKPFSFWQIWDVFGLDAGESTTKQFDFPSGRAADSYTLGADADWYDKVAESDESNNRLYAPLMVDLGGFENVSDVTNGLRWFGGDDRAAYRPRNIGVGQSYTPPGDCYVNSVGLRFSGPFDYYENPTGHGQEVTLVLNVRSDDGTIIHTVEKIVSAGFNGGWINFDLAVDLEAGEKYIFTCYLKDGEILEYFTGVYGNTGNVLPDSNGYSGQIDTYGGDMEDWSAWSVHSWDFNFRMSGIYSNVCEGDFNDDGDVDGSDLAVFALDFGRTNCDTGPDCEGDFDNDDDVDGSDLAVFAADFGRTDCPTP